MSGESNYPSHGLVAHRIETRRVNRPGPLGGGRSSRSSSKNIRLGLFPVDKFASPDAIFPSRSRKTSSCHAGDSIALGSTDKFSQSASIVCSFSSMLISSSGRIGTAIGGLYHGLHRLDRFELHGNICFSIWLTRVKLRLIWCSYLPMESAPQVLSQSAAQSAGPRISGAISVASISRATLADLPGR